MHFLLSAMPHALKMIVVSVAALEVTTPLCLVQTKLLTSTRLSSGAVSMEARQPSKISAPMDAYTLQPDDGYVLLPLVKLSPSAAVDTSD